MRGKGETRRRRKLEKIEEMTEDSSCDTDHHHTPGGRPVAMLARPYNHARYSPAGGTA